MKKKFYSFVLLAATLLLSTNIWAANSGTASLNGAAATSIDAAISAWVTNGGTLTLSSDCEFNATATTTIVQQNSVLDLAGHTLTWKVDGLAINALTISGGSLTIKDDTKAGKLSFLFTNMTTAKYGIYQETPKNETTKESCTIKDVTIECDVQAVSEKKSTILSSAVYVKNGGVSMQNAAILMKNCCTTGLYVYQGASLTQFKDSKIEYVGYTTTIEQPRVLASAFYGIRLYRCARNNSVAIENATIDLSKIPVKYYNSTSGTNDKDTKVYGLYADSNKDYAGNVITIVGGEYKTPMNMGGSAYAVYQNGNYVTIKVQNGTFESKDSVVTGLSAIESGLFKPQPNAQYAKDGYHFERQADDYYTLVQGAPLFAIDGKPYFDTNELTKYTDGKATVVIFTTEVFIIPSGTNVKLNVKDVNVAYTVVNNGNVLVSATFNGKMTNNGTLNLSAACPNGELINNGTAYIYGSSGTCAKVTNKGALIFGSSTGATQFADHASLTLVNEGKLSIYCGTFTAQQCNDFVRANVADGYRIWAATDKKEKYTVYSNTNYLFEVDEVGYKDLQTAMKACSKANPVIFHKDHKINSSATCVAIKDGKDYYYNLNGYTLTIGTAQNSKYNKGIIVCNGGLTIDNGVIQCGTRSFLLLGDNSKKDYTRLTIGKDATLTNGSNSATYLLSLREAPFCGVVVNFQGKMVANGCHGFYVNGTQDTEENAPVFNIGESADISCTKGFGIYAAGYAKWNFAGKMKADSCGIELRAGEFIMTDGRIEATMKSPADDQFNGNGSTSQACAVAACQHSTKLPVSVVINGGELKAYTPIYQANPQNNAQEDIDKVSVEVNNAKVFSTSQNIVWSANKKVVLNGGVYNLSPAAYVASGKAVVDNTGADKDLYPYAIGEKATAMTTVQAGNWDDAATWGATAIPTMATPVEIKHAVTIPASVKAQTCGIKVADGGKITVEGTVIVGNDGISGITAADQLLIKDGASMVISPAAPAANSQPLATVEVKTVIRDVKDEYQAGDRTYEYIWQNIGVPVTSMTIAPAKTLTVNTWDIVSAWVPATEFGTPFRGYHITNVDNKTAGMLYTFAGKLVGPQNAALSMPRDGFHFFGNSWTAPFDVKEILNQLQSKSASDDINSAVYVYVSDQLTVGKMIYYDGQYVDINLAKLEDAATAEAFGQIAAMQGFFLHSDAKADIALNYEKAVWNAALAKPQPSKKPASVMEEENTAVRLILTAENGRSDELYLYEGEAYAAPKMMNTKPNVNIYAITANGNYSTMGMDKIEGSKIGIQTNAKTNYTISFDWLKGETLYLRDKTADKYVAMLEDATYSFTAEANATIDDRFEIVSKSDVPGTGTAVEEVNANTEATGIYTIMGQYVGETSMWSTLPAGMYIVNGKKCVK